tara:strand:- start:504 stop:779 length:276 start_codon:yes stop_codon:yes gene_type:complete
MIYITESQLRQIITEEVYKLLKESEGWRRYLSKSSRNTALRRGDVDIPDDYRDAVLGPSTKKKKVKKKRKPFDDEGTGMGLALEESEDTQK